MALQQAAPSQALRQASPARTVAATPGDASRGVAFVPTIYMTVSDMASRYVERLRAYDDPSYCDQVELILQRQLVDQYGRMCINDFSLHEASATLNRMRRVPYPNGVIYTYCIHIRAAFESERRNGHLFDNPWNQIQLPKREPTEKRVLSDEEVRRLEEAFAHNALGEFFGFVLHTGLKKTEAAATLFHNWDRNNHQLLVQAHVDYSSRGRGQLVMEPYNGILRAIPLSPEAEACLERSLERQRPHQEVRPGEPPSGSGYEPGSPTPSDLAFPGIGGRPLARADIEFNKGVIRRLTGIGDFSCTLLRNHFVVSLLREGVPVHVLQSYLGLKDRESVLLYASFRSEGTREAAQTLEGFFDDIAPRGTNEPYTGEPTADDPGAGELGNRHQNGQRVEEPIQNHQPAEDTR